MPPEQRKTAIKEDWDFIKKTLKGLEPKQELKEDKPE